MHTPSNTPKYLQKFITAVACHVFRCASSTVNQLGPSIPERISAVAMSACKHTRLHGLSPCTCTAEPPPATRAVPPPPPPPPPLPPPLPARPSVTPLSQTGEHDTDGPCGVSSSTVTTREGRVAFASAVRNTSTLIQLSSRLTTFSLTANKLDEQHEKTSASSTSCVENCLRKRKMTRVQRSIRGNAECSESVLRSSRLRWYCNKSKSS